ncbi:MAG: hypothetical protein OXR03_08985 [Rhodospirillaceae bacterium]|nr:hypothetical protein [Rhodospirillaceae bacterium]
MHSSKVRFPIFLLIAFMLASCATGKSEEKASQDAGTARVFDAAFDDVKPATLESMKSSDLGINVKRTYQNDDGFNIIFNKTISAFSWGSVGRVLVQRVDEKKTKVFVYAAARWGAGTSEDTFATSIFDGVASRIRSK